MIKFFTSALLCFLVLTGVCQKANFKQAERFMKMDAKNLTGSTVVYPNYLKKSDKFWYSYRKADGTRYFFVDPKAKSDVRPGFYGGRAQ